MYKWILVLAAGGCVLYYCSMSAYNTGFRISQQYLWLLLAVALVALALLPLFRIPIKLLRLLRIVILIGAALFLAVEGLVVQAMVRQPKQKPDCLIVLGAGLNGMTPSHSLQLRLEKTLELMEENPELIAVVTGGQGAGEDMTEAQCMKDWLMARGIAEARIRMEDQSTSTTENFRFGLPLVPENARCVGVVTNNFHVFRSLCVAKRVAQELGMECSFEGMAAPYPSLLLVHFMVREFFTLINDALRGNIAWSY